MLTKTFNLGKLDQAKALAEKLVLKYPKHGLAWKVLGTVLQKQGFLKESIAALKRAAVLLPDDFEAHYNLGNGFYDLGQLTEAADSYARAAALTSSFAPVYYNLGSVYKDQKMMSEAEGCYKKALQIDPKNVEMHLNLGQMYFELGRFSDAGAAYQTATELAQGNASAYMGWGVACKELGDLRKAESCYKKALAIKPDYVEAYSNLGILLKELGQLDEAESAYRNAIKLNPGFAPAYNNLGMLLRVKGMLPQAEQSCRQALSIDSQNAVAHNNLGVVLRDQGRFFESEANCRKAIEIRPAYADAYNNLGLALDNQGRFAEAITAFEQALSRSPNDISILSNYSVTLITQGELAKAESSLKKALSLSPAHINSYINLGITYLAQGRPLEAESICRQVLEIQPDNLSAKSNLLFAMNYSAKHGVEDCFKQAREYNNLLRKQVEHVFAAWKTDPKPERLRVGIVSADLRQHAVAYFLENVLKFIDPDRIELIAYSADGRVDEMTLRLKHHFALWKPIFGLDDASAAKLILDDGVHLLIDLSGHSAGNRLPVFARKPAPVQVSWLGYFATTGLDAMDYFIADEVGVPKNSQNQFVEKIRYLPSTRLCFSVPDVDVPVSDLPALRNGYVTFGSFQNIAKLGDDVLSLWAKVIKAVPDARLRMQTKALGDAEVASAVLARAARFGIDPARVSLHGFDTREGYLAAHSEVDMILDTFPFNGGTTTCEALWMGVPTLTLAGDRLIARQGASLISAAGLTDWVVASPDEFVCKGVAFASDVNKLAQLRAALRAQVLVSPLFDGRLFARNMENALWQMSGLMQSQKIESQRLDKVDGGNDNQSFTEGVTMSDSLLSLLVVSATRMSAQNFWSQSALGLSLKKHMALDKRLSASVAYENSRGLSEVFNECIEQAHDASILVFIHDDVWIDEKDFADAVIAGLKSFDVIGVAGNKRRVANQPAWAFIDHQFTWDDAVNLSGRVAHGQEALGHMNDYGVVPAACELMDGVFLAARKSTLVNSNVKFDPQFDFHFYDMDFCRSARQAGLTLGTWLVNLTHQSGGAFGSAGWVSKYQLYLNKWESTSEKDIELQQAINDVLQLAVEHHQAGRLEQAVMMYEEILKIQANHAEANYHLGTIELQTKGVNPALTRLELAVQVAPEREQYWVGFIQALMQAGAIDTAVNALELGQKFGLKPDTAQALAAGFIQTIDSQ